jgi:hypothetical protein
MPSTSTRQYRLAAVTAAQNLASPVAKAVFRSLQTSKNFTRFSSHRIFRHMHGALNVGKKITNYTVCL